MLAELETEVTHCARRLWPEVEGMACRFQPLLSEQYGDLGSDFCLRLAERLRRPPEALAGAIIEQLSARDGVLWSTQSGYLNLRFDGRASALPLMPPAAPARDLWVARPEPSVACNGWEYLRLSARAVIQSVLLRQRCASTSISLCGTISAEGEAVTLFRDVLLKCQRRSQADARALAPLTEGAQLLEHCGITAIGDSSRVCVWLSPKELQGSFTSYRREELLSSGAQLVTCAPDRGWLIGVERCGSIESVASWKDPELSCLLWYLASTLRGDELDLGVPRLAERDNLPWYLRSTGERINRVMGHLLDRSLRIADLPSYPRIAFLLRTLALFEYRAAFFGEIGEWMLAVRELLDRVNAVLNSPQFRQRIVSDAGSQEELYIFSGVHTILSSIITPG